MGTLEKSELDTIREGAVKAIHKYWVLVLMTYFYMLRLLRLLRIYVLRTMT